MSTTMSKRQLHEALADAMAFRDLFPREAYERWEFAGSIRRKKQHVADVEHVIIPAFGDVPGKDLFATPTRTNLLLTCLDGLVETSVASKHVYGGANGATWRWGEKYRGVDFRGFNHELFCADADNWGATLAIRTGPAEFSQRLVTGLLRQGRRNKDGKVWRCEPCEWCVVPAVGADPDKCGKCDSTKLLPVEPIPVPDERAYFELCGMKYAEPEFRA